VRTELTRNLDHSWQAIIDTDVDGPSSVPAEVDKLPNFGRYSAARRAARAVFLATAPKTGSPNRGVEQQRVKLGCALPGEQVAAYGDALTRLTDRSSYLYVEGARYWYGTQASVARRARDLVEQYLSTRRDEVHAHIVERVASLSRDRGQFAAVHLCPAGPAEVPDTAECRLIVFGPAASHANRDSGSQAMQTARAILEHKSSGNRQYRNMVLFLGPDHQRLAELERAAAEHLAWCDIHGRWEELGLDAFGRNQAEAKKAEADRAVELRVGETYIWALIPHQPDPTGPIEWETVKTDGAGGVAERVSKKLVNNGVFAVGYAAELLRSLLSDGAVLAPMWADGHVSVNQLWDAFARYVYLPRLADIGVLCATVAAGPNSTAWEQHGFAVADSFDGRYAGLVTGASADHVTGTSLAVRPDLATAQEAADEATTDQIPPDSGSPTGGTDGEVPPPKPLVDDRLKRFFATTRLDPERYQRDFAKIAQEIVTNLAGHLGTGIEISVEIRATNDDGFPETLIRTVNENARTLKVEQYGFERE
jgi:hypothetical protein